MGKARTTKPSYTAPRPVTPEDIKKNPVLNARLKKISCDCFYIREEEYDLEKYPNADIYLLRDAKTHEVVGYNMIAIGEKEVDGKKHRFLKIGPSAVLPDYRGGSFVSATSLKTIFREYLMAIRGGYELDLMIVAGNPRFREISVNLPHQHPIQTRAEEEKYNHLLQAAAGSVYPAHVLEHLADFTHGNSFGSNWIPREKADFSAPPLKGEYKGIGTPHLIRVTTKNFLFAAFSTVFREPYEKLMTLMMPTYRLIESIQGWFSYFLTSLKDAIASLGNEFEDLKDSLDLLHREAEGARQTDASLAFHRQPVARL